MSFGKRLDALIQEKGKKEKFSQAELARRLDVSRVTVSQWVTGKANPSFDMLPKIAAALDVSPGELVSNDPREPSRVELISSAIPVYSSVKAGDGSLGFETEEKIDDLPCQPYMQQDKCFALKVSGESMTPAIQPGDNVLRVKSTKTEGAGGETIRYLEIHPELKEIIARRATNDIMFPELSEHWHEWPRKSMMAACKALGLRYKKFHGLRHSFGTYLLDSGASIMDTKDAMGHSSIKTTEKYLKFCGRRGQVKKLPY